MTVFKQEIWPLFLSFMTERGLVYAMFSNTAVVCLLLFVPATLGQFLNCDFINKLDCSTRAMQTVCGSDGKDYANRCYLAKEQCSDSLLHIITDQSCSEAGFTVATTAAPMSTTPPKPDVTTEPLFQNHDQLLDFFCLELMHEDCPQDTSQVCASDNVTYDNVCEYEKQRCSHRSLSLKNYGPCS